MNSNAICPISTNKIDEHIARLNATFTVLLITALILTNNILIATFLLVDFTLRGTENSKYSILSIVSKLIVNSLGLKKKPKSRGS